MDTVTLFAVLVCAGIISMAAIKVVSLVSLVNRSLPPNHWIRRIDRALPNWRLFGQSGGSYDLYLIVSDALHGEDPHFHLHNGVSRKWFHPLFNPHSRARFAERRAVQTVLDHHLRNDKEAPMNQLATEILTQLIRERIERMHPADAPLRSASVYIIFDRGHHSIRAPEAKVELKLFESD